MSFTTLKVPGADAIRLLEEYRSRYPASGEYPFLIGDDRDLQDLLSSGDHNKQSSAAIIRASRQITIDKWLRQKWPDAPANWRDEGAGDWPCENADKGSISVHIVSKEIKPEVYLGFAKIKEPWHLLAIVKYGGWNECPEPEVHCAFHREWQEKFGAEIAGLHYDVIECTVRKPPTKRKTAMRLAMEQTWYCTDIIAQGYNSPANLAASIIKSDYWYFWWD
jgi:hypothetical protein